MEKLNLVKSTFDELPNNIEAEQAVLGSILVSNEIFDDISPIINSKNFFDPMHQKIYVAMEKLIFGGMLANPITLKNFFENDIFNALSGNFTVNQILNKIKKIKKRINIVYVDSPIMNQLSYHVDDQKIKKKGLVLKSNIDVDIKDTLLLFKYLKNEV